MQKNECNGVVTRYSSDSVCDLVPNSIEIWKFLFYCMCVCGFKFLA